MAMVISDKYSEFISVLIFFRVKYSMQGEVA
jgi:hypothetical protein